MVANDKNFIKDKAWKRELYLNPSNYDESKLESLLPREISKQNEIRFPNLVLKTKKRYGPSQHSAYPFGYYQHEWMVQRRNGDMLKYN